MPPAEPSPPPGLTQGSIEYEGCNLVYEFTGTGPLLILIAGAGSQAPSMYPIIPYLSRSYTVIAFDRRQQSRSKALGQLQPFNPIQQARDIVAIIQAVSRQTGQKPKASIFGNSSGGMLALQVSASFPDIVDHVLVHEAPSNTLIPNGDEVIDQAYRSVDLYYTVGVDAAKSAFGSLFKGFSADDPPRTDCSLEDWENTFKYEMIYAMIYVPDLQRIKKNGVSIAVAQGIKSEDAFYAQSSYPQSEILECPRLVFPGHHTGFEQEPEAFADALLNAFKMLEERRRAI